MELQPVDPDLFHRENVFVGNIFRTAFAGDPSGRLRLVDRVGHGDVAHAFDLQRFRLHLARLVDQLARGLYLSGIIHRRLRLLVSPGRKQQRRPHVAGIQERACRLDRVDQLRRFRIRRRPRRGHSETHAGWRDRQDIDPAAGHADRHDLGSRRIVRRMNGDRRAVMVHKLHTGGPFDAR
ncbi:hypothetical protein D9M68_779050 [compost metagenome]